MRRVADNTSDPRVLSRLPSLTVIRTESCLPQPSRDHERHECAHATDETHARALIVASAWICSRARALLFSSAAWTSSGRSGFRPSPWMSWLSGAEKLTHAVAELPLLGRRIELLGELLWLHDWT